MNESEHEEKVSGLNELVSAIRDALESGDTDAAKSALDQLESAMQEEESAEQGAFEGGEEEMSVDPGSEGEYSEEKPAGRPKPSDVLGKFLGK